jgi:HK97 family phage prohead protease
MSDKIIRKALVTKTEAETLADKRQVVVNVSAESPDRVGDIVVQDGIDYKNFMAIGGTVLWQHNQDHPIARCTEMSIVTGKLRAVVQFPETGISAKSDEIYGLIKAGIVNAASIGFDPLERTDIDPKNPWGAYRYEAVELMEFSFVSVPCQAEATVVERALRNGRTKSDGEWKVGASRNLPLDEGSSWDGPAAAASIFAHADFDGDKPDLSFARKGFLFYDAANPKEKGSYKEPFAKVVGGRLTAVASGIHAAASRLPQTEGVSDDARSKARAVIDHYEAKMSKSKSGFTAVDKAHIKGAHEGVEKAMGAHADACDAHEQIGGSLDKAIKHHAVALSHIKALAEACGAEGDGKSGRAFSAENADHVRKCMKALTDMADCHAKAADLHDDLHDELEQMGEHGTSAGEHTKALMKRAEEGEDDADQDGEPTEQDGSDQELAADAGERKRQADVLALSAPVI